MKRLLAVLMLGLLVSGEGAMAGGKESAGTIIGAGAGALIGSQVGGGERRLLSVAIGALAGALIGQEVGKALDQADQLNMQRATQQALEKNPTNVATAWVNPDTGHYGEITPVKTYQQPDGQNCREYVQTVTIDGKEEQAYGTACRQGDGSWKIVR